MRKVVLLILFFACINQAIAQDAPDNKNKILGGSFSLSRTNDTSVLEDESNFISPSPYFYKNENPKLSFFINPYVAKILNKNSLFGLGLHFGHSSTKRIIKDNYEDYMSNRKTVSLGLEIFYRHSIFNKHKFDFFLEGNAGFKTSRSTYESSLTTKRETGNRLTGALGIDFGGTYALSENWNLLVILAGINYQLQKYESEDGEFSSSTKAINLNTSFRGVQIGIENRF